jgi:hypothetical protein
VYDVQQSFGDDVGGVEFNGSAQLYFRLIVMAGVGQREA